MERDDFDDLCVAVAKFPKGYRTELLAKLIKEQSNVTVEKTTTVPGAENDRNLERLVLKLGSKEDARRLYQDVKEDVVDCNGKSYTILYEKCTKCEIPLEWQGLEAAVDQASDSSASSSQNSDQPPSSHGPKPANMPHYSMQGDGQRTFYQNVPHHPHHPGFIFPMPPHGQQQGEGIPFAHGQQQGGGIPFTHGQQQGGGIPLTQEQQQAIFAQMFRMQFHQPQPQFPGHSAKPADPPPPYNSGGSQGYFPEGSQGEDATYVKHEQGPNKATLDQEEILQKLQKKGKKEAEYKTQENSENKQTDDGTATTEEFDERDTKSMEKTNKVVLKDLPSEAHKDFLQLYFEHKKFGGHEVSNVEVDRDLAMALVEFSTSEAVDDILQRAPITISKQQIRVEPYFEAEEVQELCTVTVEGLHGVDRDTIEMYFESEKRSGGDDIVNMELDEDSTANYITFKSEEVARRVVERGSHSLCGNQLEVTLWQPPKQSWNVPSPEPELESEPIPADTIQIYGLDDTIDEQTLELYFENTKRSGGDDVKDLKIRDNIAYITYHLEEVAQRVVERGQHTLKGIELTVSLWEPARDDITTGEPSDSQESACTIEVAGIDKSMDRETLALYFENAKRSGGDLIQDLYIDYGDSTAFVTFQNPEVAQRVVDRENHLLGKRKLQVKLCGRSFGTPDTEAIPQQLCTIEVEGVTPSIDEETLAMYFENKKRSGGDTVVNTIVDKSTGIAYIEFESEEVAKRVAERDSHMLSKKTLKVAIHIPHKPKPAKRRKMSERPQKTKETREENEEEEEREEQQPTCVIKVKGLTRIKSFDTMRYYFENPRRAGGGEIVDITHHEEDDDIVFLTYSAPEIAENVASRNHEVEGQSLHVSLYVPPKPRPFYKDKVLIKGLQSTTTKDCLFNFLEAKSGSVPVELQTGEKEGVVLVTFDDQPDFEKLSKICAKLPLEGATLQVFQVQVSNCIIVLNIPENTSKDTIWFYFENTRRSNGGPVDKVVMKEEECYCLVYFVDYSVVEKVLVKEHVVGANVVTVKLFLECLGCSTTDVIQTPIKLPDAFVIHDVEPSKLKFMRQSKPNRDAIMRQMNNVNADITWPDRDCKAKDIMINCTLTHQTTNVRKLVKSWKETALKNFEDFMRNIVVAKHDVIQEFWNPVMEKIKSLQITNPDAAALLADKEQGIISVVGLKQTVENVSRDISSCIKQVEDETEKEKQKVKETLTSLKLIETKMLLAQKFPSKMEAKYPSLKVKINQNKNEISFDGPAFDIKAAKVEMFETKEKYAKASVDMSGCRSFFSLYETKQAKDYIVKKLKNNHVTAVWEVNDQTLTVCSTCEQSAGKSLELIKNCVAENKIGLTAENLALLGTEIWQTMLDEQKQKYPGKVEFEAHQKVAYVCSTDDIVDEVLGAVKKCLRKNTIIEDEINFGKNINRLIEKDHKDEIAIISKKYASLNTQINFKRDNSGFTLRGTNEGLDEIKRELHILKDRVKNKQHTIERPGIASHMRSSKGKEHINTVEEKHHVVIDSPDSDDEEPFYQNASLASKDFSTIGPRIHAECIAYDVRKIYTAEGDMTELPVDVLVNTADSKLSLTGGLSKAISLKGGIEIRNACQRYIRDEGELGEGEAFLSPAGNLTAKYIVHIVGPTWKDGANNEETVLDESVLKSMKKASDKNVKSVALPAISCGVYSFPVKRATRIIAQAVKNFFREVQDSTITEVYLCDVKSDTVESFTEALVKVFGDRNVSKLPHKQPSARPKAAPRKSMPMRQPSNSDESADEAEYETLDKYQGGRNQQNVMFGGISVKIVKGEIAKESVDVIVNTTARNLDLKNGAVSASLLRAAGNQLQDEIHQKYPNGIKDGDIAVTSGKGLRCQIVIHTSLMNWDNNVAKKALHTLMNNCLNEADTKGYSSIAFPAIGTGNLGFPRDVVAKEMFTVIYNFARANPKSTINDVRFIVYQKDFGTISAFEAEEKTRLSGKGASGNRQLRQTQSASAMFKDVQDEPDSNKSGSYEEIEDDDDDDDDGTQDSGALTITVEKGDITKVKCDCIVNSSNDQLDLSKGAVSQALVKVGGAKLTNECKTEARGMKTDGMVMTSAPGLPFKQIIHVVAQDSIRAWRKMVDKCFKMAENRQLSSIAFPALGTNIQANATEIAEAMVHSLRDFEAKPHRHLQKVLFVIYKPHMVEIFRKAVEKVKGPEKGFFSRLSSLTGASAKHSLKSTLKTKKKKSKSIKVDDRDRFVIRVYSLCMKNIVAAIDSLEAIISNEIKREVFDEPALGNLQEQQRKDIQALSKKFNVEIRFSSRTKLEVIGMIQNVMEANNFIHNWLREFERSEHEKKEALQLTQIVQWFFIDITDVNQELVKYDASVNLLIENAFKSGKQQVEFSDSEGSKYIIDFTKMQEYAVDQPEDVVNVIRRDLMKDGSFNTPKEWTDMGKENVKVITLQNTDKEYQDVAAAFTKSVNSPNFEVTRIDRIQNRTLWMQYHAKKKLLDDTNGKTINEKILWHGTSVDTVDSINANGFNRSYCGKNATAFGDGVYFAVNASYSCSDTYSRPDSTGIKRMYMCRVLTGDFTLGKGGMRVPPPKAGGTTSSLYDSVVNNMASPSMFIIFHDTQAYPEYLILFKKKV